MHCLCLETKNLLFSFLFFVFFYFLVKSYHGHSMSDPGSTYRTKEDVTQVCVLLFVLPLFLVAFLFCFLPFFLYLHSSLLSFSFSFFWTILLEHQVRQMRDPIDRVRERIFNLGFADAAELKVLQQNKLTKLLCCQKMKSWWTTTNPNIHKTQKKTREEKEKFGKK